jgi:hypothetical protein
MFANYLNTYSYKLTLMHITILPVDNIRGARVEGELDVWSVYSEDSVHGVIWVDVDVGVGVGVGAVVVVGVGVR